MNVLAEGYGGFEPRGVSDVAALAGGGCRPPYSVIPCGDGVEWGVEGGRSVACAVPRLWQFRRESFFVAFIYCGEGPFSQTMFHIYMGQSTRKGTSNN